MGPGVTCVVPSQHGGLMDRDEGLAMCTCDMGEAFEPLRCDIWARITSEHARCSVRVAPQTLILAAWGLCWSVHGECLAPGETQTYHLGVSKDCFRVPNVESESLRPYSKRWLLPGTPSPPVGTAHPTWALVDYGAESHLCGAAPRRRVDGSGRGLGPVHL